MQNVVYVSQYAEWKYFVHKVLCGQTRQELTK